jgi:hypothetical protein
VPARSREAVADRVQSVKDKVGGVTPSAGDIKQGVSKGAGVAQQNPLGLALGAVAVGFVAGMLIPSTRVEDERLGPVADKVKDQARETGQEALDRGKAVAQEVAQTAQQSAQEHGQQLASHAQEGAQQVREEATSQTT